MNPDWRNDPATEGQIEKLRFFGCTWEEGRDEDITAAQANDALKECARLFPDKEAAYLPTVKVKVPPQSGSPPENIEVALPEVTIQEDVKPRASHRHQHFMAQGVTNQEVVESSPLSNRCWVGLQEVTIQEAAKPQNLSPQEYTIPARDVQEFAQRQPTFAERTLNELLKDCPASDGCYWLPVAKAASLTFITTETKITLGRSRLIANKIEAAGFCVEPDVRFGNCAYDWNQTLGLFKPLDGCSTKPSSAYFGTANLFRLCVLVAAADGRVDQVELDVARQVIENQLDFSEADHQRLLVLERLLTQDPSSASKTLARVAKAVPAQKRLLIGKVLVRVAAADNVITKAERRALERIFKAFEILPDTLADLMREACPPPHEVTTQEGGTRTSGERIPPVAAPTPRGFALDMAKVYSITNETREVVGILSVVMEDEPETITLPKTVTAPAPEIPEISSESKTTLQPTRFKGLDTAFHPVLERLLTRDTWPQADFNVLARDFHFMPLNIHDTLNEWADEVLGDFILHGEDPVVIRRELIVKETS